VHEQQASEDLVDEVLDVFNCQVLAGVDHTMEVRLHELGDYVDVAVTRLGLGLEQVHHVYYVFVFEKFCIRCMNYLTSLFSELCV
jgi:putative lipoic acid-binding regulatory protein